jgi:mRNA interferase MazF
VVIKRGDVWWVELDAASENGFIKTRLCLVVSPDELTALGTAIVAPLVNTGTAGPFRPAVTVKDVSGVLLLEQIRAVESAHLKTRLGRLDDKGLSVALGVLRAMFSA